MTDQKTAGACQKTCWIAGGLLGFAAFLLVNKPWILAIVVGVVLAVAVALLLQRFFCADLPAVAEDAPAEPATKSHAPVEKTSPNPAGPAEPATLEAAMEDVTRQPAARGGEVAIEGAEEPQVHEGPVLLDAPKGEADDLKMIKGVGPQIEKKLNDLGIFHYGQIAAWDEDDVAFIDDKLSFRGRVTRDGWIAQAGELASGAETEFSKKASKDGRYEA